MHHSKRTSFQAQLLTLFIVFCFLLVFFHNTPLFAQSEVEALKGQITERTNRLSEIEKEIAGYQADLKKVGGEKNSLQKAINQSY